MASKEQSVTLLRQNKRAQVAALNSLGFQLGEDCRAADFTQHVRWGAGLLDLNVAVNRKRDNRKFFLTLEEWQSLSATEQEAMAFRGIRVRACGLNFTIAPDTILNKEFGSPKSTPDLHPAYNQSNVFTYSKAYDETQLILGYYNGVNSNGVVGAPAAEAANTYKAFTLERDGVDDTSHWCLMTMTHALVINKYKPQINAMFSAVLSSEFNIREIRHWSCRKYDGNTTDAYFYDFSSGIGYAINVTTKYAVRPICEEE